MSLGIDLERALNTSSLKNAFSECRRSALSSISLNMLLDTPPELQLAIMVYLEVPDVLALRQVRI